MVTPNINLDLNFIPNTIREVARAFLAFKEELRQASREDRIEVANFFQDISECLAAVTASLRDDEVPHGKCGEMKGFATQLSQKVGRVIKDKSQVADLAAHLDSAYEVEALWEALQNLPNREEELAKLDEASGKFRGLAISIRPAD